MSRWIAGKIEKQMGDHPTRTALVYGVASLAAMAYATPTGALISFAGAGLGALATALPLSMAPPINKSKKWASRGKVAFAAVVGAVFPFAAAVYGGYNAFKVSNLIARRGSRIESIAPAVVASHQMPTKAKR